MGWYHLGYWGGGHDLSHGGLGARVHWGGVWDGVGDHWSSDHWGASSDFSHHWGTSAHTHNSRFLANLKKFFTFNVQRLTLLLSSSK